jgi:hypothetical protein
VGHEFHAVLRVAGPGFTSTEHRPATRRVQLPQRLDAGVQVRECPLTDGRPIRTRRLACSSMRCVTNTELKGR